ncbi:ABC transporter ATP-binding protein [bacterium]|nr:ABC transporter ATP-binding protein [bacterium]
MPTAIKIENVSKRYRLGTVGTGTISDDLARVWAKFCGREDPTLLVTEINDRTKKATSATGDSKSDYVWALNDINLEVEQGEVLGIIGRNGAGKSTLLKLLSRVTAPTTGSIKTRGRIASLLEVGTGFHPELTGRENIYLNGAILGMRHREVSKQLDAIIDFSGCEKYVDTPVKRYSSGMTVRLGFAVAAYLPCEILIVDEVLAVGDAEFQKRCLGKMRDVSTGEGRTVLFVSHNMASMRTLCPNATRIENGRLMECGPASDVIEHYLTEDYAEPLTETKINGDSGRGQDVSLTVIRPTREAKTLCGDPINFNFEIESPYPVSHLGASLLFRKYDGSPVIGMSSAVQGIKQCSIQKNKWHIGVDLGKIPLNAGSYTVDVYITSGEHQIAKFSNAYKIELLENDVFGWGKAIPNSNNWGNFFWAPRWEIDPTPKTNQ